MSSLPSRLIASYVAVVLLALLVATGVYLARSLSYKEADAYAQLSTSLYLVTPQIEDALVQQLTTQRKTRVLSATLTIRTQLLTIENEAGLTAAEKERTRAARAQIRTQLQQIDLALLEPRLRAQTVALVRQDVGAMRTELGQIETLLGPRPAGAAAAPLQAALAGIRANLARIDAGIPAAPALQEQDILSAASHIPSELDRTKFRLIIVARDGHVVLDSATSGNMRGGFINHLPAALIQSPPTADPVEGQLPGGDANGQALIYEGAPPRILLEDVPNRLPVNYYILLAERQPVFLDVVGDFVKQFLGIGVLAILVALGLGWILARSLTRPIAALSAATHEIAQGHYGHQAPVSGSREMQGLATDFNRMVAGVQRTHQAQRDFLANISHDLKTPLTSIQGFSQAIVDGVVRDPQAFRETATVINAEAVRMARLVADVVDLARLQGGATAIERQPADVAGLLQQAARSMQPQASERQVALQVENGALPLVPADADRLRRAITNLLDNAVRHTPPGGRVVLGAQPVPGAVRISVKDSGSGIPAGDLPRIFERFYQVDKSRAPQGQGSGLGLAIVREVVSAHGGTITVQSAPGQGSEFVITLPAT